MIAIPHHDTVYKITPDMRLVSVIEDELGAIPALAEKFSGAGWKIGELVALIQMFLQAAGKTVDYMVLGDLILRDIEKYRTPAQKFLKEAAGHDH